MKNRYVVYTVLFGNSEILYETKVSNRADIDFICFTDNPDLKSESWQIIPVNSVGIDTARESRRPKILAHEFLGDYDVSLYMDNTIELQMDPIEIFEKYPDEEFVCFKHPERDCIYDEAEVVISLLRDDERRVREQMDFYRRAGYPEKAGLIAGGFLLRKHNSPAVIEMMNQWFIHVLRFSKRDQLSFNFVARRLGFSPTILDLNLRENFMFTWPRKGRVRVPAGFDGEEYKWLNPDVARENLDPYEHYIEVGRAENRRYRYFKPLRINQLANKYKSDKGDMYYNRQFLSRVYEHYFRHYQTRPISILEIGLLRHDLQAAADSETFSSAPSLEIWREYFSSATIYGLDIADFSGFKADRCVVLRGDQGNRDDLELACKQMRTLPVFIIDDGSHASHHQQISLGFLFQKLQPGGYYFIEDLLYQPPQWEKPDAVKTQEVLKNFLKTGKIQSPYLTDEECKYLENNIDFIKFYDSLDYNALDIGRDGIAVIKKKESQFLVDLPDQEQLEDQHEEMSQDQAVNPEVHSSLSISQWRGSIILFLKRKGYFKDKVKIDLELLKSSDYFDEQYYLNKYPAVKSEQIEPALHYLLYGGYEGLAPSKLFDSQWYLDKNPDVKNARINPLVHYLKFGKAKNRESRPLD